MLQVYESAYPLYVVTYKICQMLQSWDKLLSASVSTEIHRDFGITVQSSGEWFCPMSNKTAGLFICSEFKQIKLNWIVHQNALWRLVFSTTRPWCKQISAPDASRPPARNDDRSPIWKQKHLKTSDIFSLPRISTKDFPYIKGKIDRSIGINYSSVNFKWTQVFLCYQSFDRRGQWIFIKYRSYKISLNQRVSLWYGWELRWIELGCVRRPTSQEMK